MWRGGSVDYDFVQRRHLLREAGLTPDQSRGETRQAHKNNSSMTVFLRHLYKIT